MSRPLREIRLSDVRLLEQDRSRLGDSPSQLNAYLAYLTREEMSIQVHLASDLRFLVGWSLESEEALYGPPHPLLDSPSALLAQLAKCQRILQETGDPESRPRDLYVFLLNRECADAFAAIGARVFPTPDDDNYIYRTDDVVSLKGNRLKSHRQNVHYFRREFGELDERELDAERVRDAEAVMQQWMQLKVSQLQRQPESNSDLSRNLRDDHQAAIESLRNLPNVPFIARIYYLKGDPVGFMVGLPLDDETLLLVVQKSVRIRGLSEAVFHRFAQSMRGHYAFLNGGSDAGSDSLRFHKEHLGPCRMLKTYGACLPGSLLEAQRPGG